MPISQPNLEYDADNDGDGILEGIWLDLNYPPSILSDGRIAVPLFFTVLDADSPREPELFGQPFRIHQSVASFHRRRPGGDGRGNNTPVPRSNFGMTPRRDQPQLDADGRPDKLQFPESGEYGGKPLGGDAAVPGILEHLHSWELRPRPGRDEQHRRVVPALGPAQLYRHQPQVPPTRSSRSTTTSPLACVGRAAALLNGVNTGVALQFPAARQSGQRRQRGDQYAWRHRREAIWLFTEH